MRAAARLAFVTLTLAACGGKKDGGEGGSATASAKVEQRPSVPDHVALPTLAAGARAENVPTGPVAFASATAIVVEGTSIVAVADGKVDPAELEGGANGLKIPRLTAWAAQWGQLPRAASSEAWLLGIDPALPSAVPLQVIVSLKGGPLKRFAFLVRTPDGVGTVPIELPDRAAKPASPPAANPEDMELGMFVMLAPDRVTLWSLSELEGSLQAPKAVFEPARDAAWLTHLRDSLTDIRRRRWDGRARPEYQKEIVVMVDPRVASGDLVNTIAAVRVDAKGEALFPDVRLATGFDAPELAQAPKPPPVQPSQPADDTLEGESTALAYALAGESDSGRAAELADRRPGSDLGAQIDLVKQSGSAVAVGGGGAAKTPSGRIAIAGKNAFDDTSLTVDAVLQKVLSAYMGGLKRCYKDALNQDPTARGRVSLNLTINDAGRVTSTKATGFAAEIDACVEAQMANWRFPVPKDADGEATEASFQITLQLVPD